MEKCDDDLGTFVANGGYHYNKEVEINWLAPTLAAKTSRRTEICHCESTASLRADTRHHRYVLAATELSLWWSVPSGSKETVRAAIWLPKSVDHGGAVVGVSRETNMMERKIEPEGERVIQGEGEREMRWAKGRPVSFTRGLPEKLEGNDALGEGGSRGRELPLSLSF